MPSFLTLISADSESWSRQRRCKLRKLLTHHAQTQEKGPPCSLRSSRPSYDMDFPACNVQNTPHLLPFLLTTHEPPPPVSHLYWQALSAALPATHVLPLPALSSLLQTQQQLSEILSLWQGRSQYRGSYLFMCGFIPSQG